MRIENLANEINLNTKATRRRPSVGKSEEVGGRGDSVQLSGVAKLLSGSDSVEDVRSNRIEAVKQRVRDGYYDRPEVREAIADAVLASGAVEPVIAEVQEIKITQKRLPDVPDVRKNRVEEVGQKVRDGLYENEEIKREIAGRVLDFMLG